MLTLEEVSSTKWLVSISALTERWSNVPGACRRWQAGLRPKLEIRFLTQAQLVVLLAAPHQHRSQRLAHRTSRPTTRAAVPTRTGRRLSAGDKLRSRLGGEKRSPRTGVPPVPLHDARHTAATKLLRAGVPVKVVAQRLGHADVAVTMRVYQHVTAQDDRSAAEILERALATRV